MIIRFSLASTGIDKNITLTLTDNWEDENYTFKTPLKISEENWDKEKQRPVNIYIKEYKTLNNKLNILKLEITHYVDEIRKKRKKIPQKALAKKIKELCENLNTGYAENSLLYFMNSYIDSRKELICHSTYKRYKVFRHLLERFEGHICKRLKVDEINSDFVKNFLAFGKHEEYSENTIYRTIHFVRTILNFAERKGVRTCVRELEIRREKRYREMITLTESEIVQIRSTEVPERLKAAKDWLIISCYTGQRFSDFICFTREQLITVNGRLCIHFTQQKTGKEILLPLHPLVEKIIKKNKNSFPESMNMRYYNESIKRIAKLAGLDHMLKGRKRIGYRSKNLQIPKWEFLTSHIGRRSFATNFYGKIPTPLLMDATGHSTEQMFLKYINPVDKGRMINLGNYFNRIYKENL
ncbi:phage integrase SAM-like domain-containing protein [Chryseobacterium sp. CT-SW4]|uniref:phage integrase SAM-like domain-containing protein n=1 Tax=Chryseobacterium sp. SW-1 TaxID=3157343 RepID=UPI003B02CCAB